MKLGKKFSRILVTAGPTRERLDSVRFISNFSTGNMGYELAKAALRKGYKVTLISGPTALRPPKGARFIRIEEASQMDEMVRRNFKESDCLFMASAVCDWRAQRRVRGKIKKGPKKMSLQLVRTPDILKKIKKYKDGRMVVGFALESKALIKNAKEKLKKKNLDLIVANKVAYRHSPFGEGRTDVTIIDRDGKLERVSNAAKKEVAVRLIDRAERLWQEGR